MIKMPPPLGFRRTAGLMAALLLGPALHATAELPPLLSRAVVFEDSERGNPVLSADGRRIAYCAPVGGVANIWVRSVGKQDDRVVTRDTGGGIDYCFWQADGEHVLYFKDAGGDENSHLFQTDVGSGETRDLTPLPGARARALIADDRSPDTLLVHINARDKRFFDLYRIDLRSGELTLDTVNPGDVSRFHADNRLRVRAADVVRDDNSAEVRVRDDERSPWRTLITWGSGEMNSDLTGVVGFTPDDAGVLVMTSLGANAERLLEVSVRSGRRRVVAGDPRFDIAAVMVDPLRRRLQAVGFAKERMTWEFRDREAEADFAFLAKVRPGEIRVRGRDRGDRTWLVCFQASDRPTAYYLFDRSARTVSFLFSEDPKLEEVCLAAKAPVRFRARDGMEIHGYLTLPVGVPARRLPLVVLAHGGPWTRVGWDLDFPVQFLANRGYAVLQVNFRGSTGYGKAYQNAGDREFGGKVIQDLVDGKEWAVARGVADRARTAVMGSSFGGYAALAALAFHPGEFGCGIAVNAISDANLFMATLPPYWTVGRARWEKRMGKDPEFLRQISPLHRAARVSAPLLLIHNANDVRVSREHAERMAAALRENGKDVTYLLFQGAGHMGGGPHADLLRRWAAVEAFLGKHLGGRVEPAEKAEDPR